MNPTHSTTHHPQRRVYRAGLRLLAGSLLLCFLAGSPFQPGLAQSVRPQSPAVNDFIVALAADPANLDPALATDAVSFLLASQLYDTLVDYQPGGSTPIPGLAESWSHSADGLVWTLNLRPGLTFHDGTTLDASAVLYNLQRWWDPAHPAHTGGFVYFEALFGGYKGDPGCLITDVAAPTPAQLQITFSKANLPLPAILAMPAFSIASPTALAAGTLSTLPVGSGAFVFVSRVPGNSLVLAANPAYWAGAPLVDSLSFLVIPNAADRFAALTAGSVDSVDDVPDNIAVLAAADPAFQVLWRPSANVGYLGINRAHTPLDNLLVRQAIAHAIDWDALLAAHYTPGDQLASQFLPPMIWGYNPSLTGYTYDPVLSASLLNLAGYPTGFTTSLSYRAVVRAYLPNPAATANAIKPYLDAVGIQTTVTEYESGVFLNKAYNGELDLFLLGWGADYFHPDNFYPPHLCDPTNIEFGPLDAALCSDLQTALAEPNFDQQVLDYQAAAQDVYDSLPFVPIVHTRTALLARQDAAGLVASPLGFDDYRTVHLAGAVQELIVPAAPATLVFTDPQSEPTTIELPSGAVTQTVILRYEPAGATSIPPAYASANHSFALDAILEGEPLDGFAFTQPVTITIDYSDADVAQMQEDTLLLFIWNGSDWIDAATTCSPASTYVRDLAANRLSLPVCHLTSFALLGELPHVLFFPLLAR